MSSAKTPPVKTEQQRVWELEEQLNDEQYAHCKTKFALRSAQLRLEQTNIGDGDQNDCELSNMDYLKTADMEKTIEDLRRENSRLVKAMNENVKSMEMLKLENEDLTNMMKAKDQEMSDKLHKYECDIEELTKRNEELQDANLSHVLALKYTESMRIENRNLQEELKKNENIQKLNALLVEKSDIVADVKKAMENLRKECSSLEKSNNEFFTVAESQNIKTPHKI